VDRAVVIRCTVGRSVVDVVRPVLKPPSRSPRVKAAKARRTISTFSCDIALRVSPGTVALANLAG
jgi:hypothetical protein